MAPIHLCVMVGDEFLQRDVMFRQPINKKEGLDHPPFSHPIKEALVDIYLVILVNLSKIGASKLTISTNGLIANSFSPS